MIAQKWLSGSHRSGNSDIRQRRSHRSRRHTPVQAAGIEVLESRRLLSFPPSPIDPSAGEANLLKIINSLPLNDIDSALDHFPVPYVVVATANGAAPTVANNRAGAPTRIDADRSKTTGKGGNDIQVEVNTELLPTPHLRVNINRIEGAPYAQNLTVLIAFPFDAFNTEALPGSPNLFIGYQTTAADGTAGGVAPATEEIRFIPGVLGGTDHTFELQMNTTGDTNPLRFIAGHFDGDNAVGILNADAMSAWVQNVPDQISLGLDVGENALADLTSLSSFGLDWTATSPSKVVFDYLEKESAPDGTNDYNTTVTFDQMPTQENLTLSLDEQVGTFTLSHTANAVIDEVQILKQRADGLTIVGTLSDVPTSVALTVDMDESINLDVNANTLDASLEIIQEGGFFDTSDFFGYDIGYAKVGFTDVPDLTATWGATEDRFGVVATNPGEYIGGVEFIIDDDAHYDPVTGDLVGLDLPPEPPPAGFEVNKPYHLFSIVDDGTHGTAAARVLYVAEATLDLDPDASKAFNLVLGQGAPMVAYGRFGVDSSLISPDPNKDIEIRCLIDELPAGTVEFHFDGPGNFGYQLTPLPGEDPVGIDSVKCVGHIGSLNFETDAGDLPPILEFDFEPDEYLTLKAEETPGVPDRVGHLAVRLWDESDAGLPDSSSLFGAGNPLHDARARVDDIPSFHATWSDTTAGTSVHFNTDANDAILGGVQISVSTEVELAPLPAATATSDDYVNLFDADVFGMRTKRLGAGAFGIDEIQFDSADADNSFTAHYDTNGQHKLVATFNSDFGGSYFPQYDTNLTFTVDSIPQLFDVMLDLDPALVYTASSGIDLITLTGTIDDTADGTDSNGNPTNDPANDTQVNFEFHGLPAQVRFHMQLDEVKIIDGGFDVNGDNAVNADDDGEVGGLTVIDGSVDYNNDGVINGADDGVLIGVAIVDGRADTNNDGVADGDDDGGVAGVELRMSDDIDKLVLQLESTDKILSTPYQLLDAEIITVPARVLASWSGKKILVETADSSGNPKPLGSVSALLSTDRDQADIDEKLKPFTTAGPGGERIGYSAFTQRIDERYYNGGLGGATSGVLSRLNELYNDAEVLDSGEDHIVGRLAGDKLDIASFQYTGFQKLLIDPETDGGTYEFRNPTAGLHPLFVGVGKDDTFAMLQIDNIPDVMTLKTNIAGKDIRFQTSDDTGATAGDIDVYVGPGSVAQESDDATRFVMLDVPDDVHIFWNFGFPSGGAFFEASNPFELLFLTQDGSSRITAGLRLEDLSIQYGLDILPLDVDVDWTGPIPTSIDLRLLNAWAGIFANHGVDGFFSLYGFENSPKDLNDGTPNDGGEYVPQVTLLMNNFTEFKIDMSLDVEVIPATGDPQIEGPNITINGDFVFDFWSADDTDWTTSVADYDIGFINPPDYTDNTPFHIIPFDTARIGNPHDLVFTFDGFHYFADHFDPYA